MQYLPIYPEKSWLETVVPDPMEQQMYKWDWWENLPMYYGIWNDFFNRVRSNNPADYFVAGVEWAWALPTLVVDALWNIWNYAYNGYKRAYNYWANAYNNLADTYNNRQMQRRLNYAPGNSNTWRRIVGQPIVPTLQQNLPTRPTRYLVGPNWNIVAQIVN